MRESRANKFEKTRFVFNHHPWPRQWRHNHHGGPDLRSGMEAGSGDLERLADLATELRRNGQHAVVSSPGDRREPCGDLLLQHQDHAADTLSLLKKPKEQWRREIVW